MFERLSKEFRRDLRFFAFFVGNGTLFAGSKWSERNFSCDYFPFLKKKDDIFGRLFSVFINVWQPGSQVNSSACDDISAPSFRAGQYLKSCFRTNFEVHPPFSASELEVSGDDKGWKEAVKRFALTFGKGNLEPQLLADVNYIDELVDYGSGLEPVINLGSLISVA